MSEIELVPDLFSSTQLTHEKFSSILTFDTDRPGNHSPLSKARSDGIVGT